MNPSLHRALLEGRSDNLRLPEGGFRSGGSIAATLAREAARKRAAREDVCASTSGQTENPNPARK